MGSLGFQQAAPKLGLSRERQISLLEYFRVLNIGGPTRATEVEYSLNAVQIDPSGPLLLRDLSFTLERCFIGAVVAADQPFWCQLYLGVVPEDYFQRGFGGWDTVGGGTIEIRNSSSGFGASPGQVLSGRVEPIERTSPGTPSFEVATGILGVGEGQSMLRVCQAGQGYNYQIFPPEYWELIAPSRVIRRAALDRYTLNVTPFMNTPLFINGNITWPGLEIFIPNPQGQFLLTMFDVYNPAGCGSMTVSGRLNFQLSEFKHR